MQAHFILAANVTTTTEGSVLVERIGAARYAAVVGQRAHLRLAPILFLQYDASDAGPHVLRVTVRGGDGQPLADGFVMDGGVEMRFGTGGEGMLPFPGLELFINLPLGRYEIRVEVDGRTLSTWPFLVDPRST